jgi:hypothetical protein
MWQGSRWPRRCPITGSSRRPDRVTIENSAYFQWLDQCTEVIGQGLAKRTATGRRVTIALLARRFPCRRVPLC